MVELATVGQPVPRVDALDKVTGRANYVRDIKLPGMLYGKVVRSPYAHARILSIDTTKAERLPGVKVVLTAKDAPAEKFGRHMYDQSLMAGEVVRFVGEPVAVVAAVSKEVAEEAMDLVEVAYEELPAVFDAEEAMGPNPPAILHPDLPSYQGRGVIKVRYNPEMPNVFNHVKIRRGDVERGFQEADLIMESRFTTARIHHCQMDPYCTLARAEPDGGVTLWSGVHLVNVVKSQVSRVFHIPPSKVRIITQYIGGDFGGRPILGIEFFAVLLSLKTGRPVRMDFTREETFTCTATRNPAVIYIKDGVKGDGTLVAREIKVVLNGGAYSQSSPLVTRNSQFGAVSTYRVPNFKWDSYGVYTNEPPSGSFRGFGTVKVSWAIESHMDMLAEKLGMDPVEFREKNILREGDTNVTGEIVHSIGAAGCLDKVAEWIGWGKKPEQPGGPWRIGKGLAVGGKHSMSPTAACATVKIHEDATIEVRHGIEEVGQGCNTILAQIAAEEFGVPMDTIKVVWGDTTIAPYDEGSSASRATYNTGNAVRLACQDAKRHLFELASRKLEVPPESLETKGGRIYLKDAPEVSIGIPDLFVGFIGDRPGGYGSYVERGGELLGKATWVQRTVPEDRETGQIDPQLAAKGMRLVSFFLYGAQAAEVAVNVETGEVRVLRFCSAFDMGQPMNPKLCEAQMEGGAGMGIGSTLYEEMVVDNGVVANSTFMDYKIPTCTEMPMVEKVKSMMACAPHKDGPFGAKGLGEGTMIPTAPAITNAIYNAIGVRLKELPATRERVLRAVKGQRGAD